MNIKKFLLIVILLVASFLRLYKLSSVPVSLFGDELDVGYHAYSILKTGRDYSGNFMPLHFQSLAEWRTPLYLYSSVPTVAIWGISPLGVRLPAAIFGILGVWGIYLLVSQFFGKEKWSLGLISAFVLALSPWHIQYSRGGFEVTELLAFLIFGLYFFFKSMEKGKNLWISVALLVFTPWIYSTAKLFTPMLLLSLFLIWKKEILSIERKSLIGGMVVGLIIGLPVVYSTLFGGGSQRFGYISVFSDPTIPSEVATERLNDARVREEGQVGQQPSFLDRGFHNKLTFWTENISRNMLLPFSTSFLFIKGDLNLRHAINGVGEFYKIEAVALLLGLIFFFTRFKDRRIKIFIALWILLGVIPAALTRDGGNHATRLILILPPLVFLISYGILEGAISLRSSWQKLFILGYVGIFLLNFINYQHEFWVHNPWESERWWHAGWGETIKTVKQVDKDYDRVFISMSGEPAWIFFAGHYEYPPDKWHEGFPMKDGFVEGFGGMSYIDKFYFGSPDEDGSGIYGLNKYITARDLYVANAKESGENLIMYPERTPPDLKLIKAVAFPSGEPAFYIFSKK